MPKKNQPNKSNNSGSAPKKGFSIRREGQEVESRNIDPMEAARFAMQNPEMFQESADAPVKADVKPISRADGRSKTPLSGKKSKAQTKKTAKNQKAVDFSVFDEAIRDQYGSEDSLIESGPTDRSVIESSSEDNLVAKAKARFSQLMPQQQEGLYLDPSELGEEADEFFALASAELIARTPDKKFAKLKALELEVLGFKTEIEQDFNDEYLVYKLPTEIIAFTDRDESFVKIGSGVFVDGDSGVWYLNSDNGVKYLIKAGTLSEMSVTEKPDNYDFIKNHTPEPELFQLEGTDLNIILSQNDMLKELGIAVVDKENNLISLSKYSKDEMQQIFISYGISALITEIYKTS